MRVDLGIFFLLDPTATEYTLDLATQINQISSVKTSVCSGNLPHISLFQGRFLSVNEENLIEIIKKIFSNYLPVSINLKPQLELRSNGNIFWNVEKSEELQILHRLALQALCPLTGGLLMDQMQNLLQQSNISEKDKEHIKKYGSLLSAENFNPHITICNVIDSKEKQQSLSQITPETYSWMVFEYQIGRLREDGSVAEVIFKGKLKTDN